MANKKVRYLLLIAIVVLAAAAFFVMTYDFPQEVNITYPAVKYRVGDSSTAQTTKIMMKGKLLRPLFGYTTFEGQIIIDEYEFTKSYSLFDVVLYKGMGTLMYNGIKEGKSDLITLGSIWTASDFEKFNMYIYEPLDGDRRGKARDLRISAPANTYNEAMQIDRFLRARIKNSGS